jgi:iron complex outermembrane recepter protein
VNVRFRIANVLGAGGTALAFCAAAVVNPATASAADEAAAAAAEDNVTLEEVVVTANKREQSIQRVGIAISAMDSAALETLGGQQISALANYLPSVQIEPLGGSLSTIINIRGVSQNDYSDTEEAPIAFYSDGAYISALDAIGGMTFDIDRVEVDRGPQGTLFGRNATGGVVQVTSAQPTRELSGFFTATGGSYGSYQTEGAISGPLNDSIRARLSFTTSDGGDYMKNLSGPAIGGEKFYAARFQVAADVGDHGELTTKLQIMRNDQDRSVGLLSWAPAQPNALGQGEFIAPNQLGQFPNGNGGFYTTCPGCDGLGYKQPVTPYTVSFDTQPRMDRTFFSGTANYVQHFGDVSLTSISDYQYLHKSELEDEDMTPLPALTTTDLHHFWQASEELRLAGVQGPLTWTAGLYALRLHSEVLSGNNLTQYAPFGVQVNFDGAVDTRSLATFGQVEYALNDKLSLIGGLRYGADWKKDNYVNTIDGVNQFTFDPALYPEADQVYKNWSGRAELDYTPNATALYYLSANRGTKGGGFNTPLFGPFLPEAMPFRQEVLTDYEGGVKLTLLDRSAHLNLSVFHYNYHDYQSYQPDGIILTLRNENAYTNGAEAEFNITPARGLVFQLFGTYLDAIVKNVALYGTDLIIDRSMPEAPKWSFGGLARYSFDLGPGELTLQTNWKYNSLQYFTVFNEPVNTQAGYLTDDVRASYKFANSPFELAAFVNNVADREYRLFGADDSSVFGNAESLYARPRWFGASVTYRFN